MFSTHPPPRRPTLYHFFRLLQLVCMALESRTTLYIYIKMHSSHLRELHESVCDEYWNVSKCSDGHMYRRVVYDRIPRRDILSVIEWLSESVKSLILWLSEWRKEWLVEVLRIVVFGQSNKLHTFTKLYKIKDLLSLLLEFLYRKPIPIHKWLGRSNYCLVRATSGNWWLMSRTNVFLGPFCLQLISRYN